MRNLWAMWVAGLWLALATAPALAAPVGDYGKLPAVEQMSLSPSGEKLAYLAVVGDERRLVVAKAGGEALFAIRIGGLRPRRVDWLGDGHVLIQASRTLDLDPFVFHTTQRQETTQSTIVDAATGAMKAVFAGDRMIFHATFGYFGYARSAGQEYGYFAGITLGGSGESFIDFGKHGGSFEHGYADLYRVNLATGASQKVSAGAQRVAPDWVVAADGTVVARGAYDIQSGDWRAYVGPGLAEVLATEADPTGEIGLLGQGRTPGSVLIERPGEGGDWERVEYSPGGAKARPFGDTPVRRVIFDPVSQLLIGGVTNDYSPRTLLFDPAEQAVFDKISRAFPGERVALVSASAGLQRMLLHAEGPGDAGTFFLADVPSRKISAVGWDYPTIAPAQVAATQVLAYKAADGLAMDAIVTLPPGRPAKDLPVVVLPHGGPQGHDTLAFDWWAQALASRGYAVLQPNFRGSDGAGMAFRDAGYGQWGRKMQTDVSDGLAALAAQGVVDPKRACIVGASYGGYAALAGVTVQHGLYRCAVAVSGVSDLNAMLNWEHDRYGDRSPSLRYWRKFMGAASDGDSALRAWSPARLAAKADAPILLVHGRDDTTVPMSQSRSMRDALASAGKPVELVELAGEDHYMSTGATRAQMLQAVVAFVEKNNPP